MTELNYSNSAITYRLYAKFDLQPYLIDVNVAKYRIALSRLRVSAHRLEIEAGRWHRPVAIERCDRKCISCNILEDEFHFVLECKMYKELRIQYLKKYYYCRPNIPTFVELLTSTNVNVNRNLALFVYKAMALREKYHVYYG